VRPLAICTIALALALPPGASALEPPRDDAGWERYRDPEARVALDLPAHVFSAKSNEPERSERLFSTRDGRAQLRVFARANKDNENPRTYLRRVAKTEKADFTYMRTTTRFFVASGKQGGMIFYRRCNFSASGRRIGCFHLDYPQREKRAWDTTVTRMSRSLQLLN
jgi:hypothetical protein